MVTVKTLQKKKAAPDDQLAKLRGQVAALRSQLARAQRLATMGTMTAMVAHEFNNILTPIINYAQLAKMNPKLADKAIDRAADGGRRAACICNAILGMTREAAQPARIDLAELVADTLCAMAREPQKDGIELRVSIPPDLDLVGRRVELQQVLLNLLINARAAVLGKPGLRRIEITASTNGDIARICVQDNGTGIEPKNLAKIFEPFFTTKTGGDDGGSGLGLAICRQILTDMGGEISVSSEPGEGAAFTVSVPLTAPSA